MSAEASKLCKPTDRTRAGGRQPPGRWVAVRWARGSLLGQQTGFGNRRWLDSTVNRVAHFFFLKKQTTSVLLNKTAGRKHAHGYSGHGLGGCCPNTTVLLWLVGKQHSSWPDPQTSSCRTRRESKDAGHTVSKDTKRLSLSLNRIRGSDTSACALTGIVEDKTTFLPVSLRRSST